jgi:hypothetical protein
MKEVSSQSIKIPKLIADHLRWIVVLAQLNRIAGKEYRYPVAQLVRDLQLDRLFPDRDGKIDRSPYVGLTRKGWDIWCCGKSVDKGESPLNSIYQCRTFYGLDAPNNLLQRLTKLLEMAIDSSKSLELEPRRGKKDSKYDRYVEQWGEYALQLVVFNGGWEAFSQKSSLTEIKDLWLGLYPPKLGMTGADRDSLIQRVLYLDADRYIQVLTVSIGLLYPLWFFGDEGRKERLERLTANDRQLKKALPKRDLYIDVNTHIGKMAGLPYPLGIADDILSYCWDVELTQLRSKITDLAWQSIAIKAIATELQNEYWSPPLLFTMWSDELPVPDDDLHNYSIPLIAITQGTDRFAEIYQRRRYQGDLAASSLGIEPFTYGEKIFDRLQSIGIAPPQKRLYRRSDILTKNFDTDAIATYFPPSLLLEIDLTYERLTNTDIYRQWGAAGDAFNYRTPQLVLAGGMFLSRQAKAADLIIDLGAYLHLVELLIRSLRPEWDSIAKARHQLAGERQIAGKLAAAEAIASACAIVAQKTKLVKTNLVSPTIVPEILGEIASEMTIALLPSESERQEECLQHIYGWGWAKLFDAIEVTSIYIACELFTG